MDSINSLILIKYHIQMTPSKENQILIYIYSHWKKIGVNIKKCIVFEDTKSGVKSAFTANAKVIGMTAGRNADNIWKFEKVVNVINDFSEIDVDKLNDLYLFSYISFYFNHIL